MAMCAKNQEFLAQFDRLRGTNVSRCLPPISQASAAATGKFEADARAFFDFCLDLYHRLPKAGQ